MMVLKCVNSFKYVGSLKSLLIGFVAIFLASTAFAQDFGEASNNDGFNDGFNNGFDDSIGYSNDDFGSPGINQNNRIDISNTLIQSACEDSLGVAAGQSRYCNCYANAIKGSGLSASQTQALAININGGHVSADPAIIVANQNAQSQCYIYK